MNISPMKKFIMKSERHVDLLNLIDDILFKLVLFVYRRTVDVVFGGYYGPVISISSALSYRLVFKTVCSFLTFPSSLSLLRENMQNTLQVLDGQLLRSRHLGKIARWNRSGFLWIKVEFFDIKNWIFV